MSNGFQPHAELSIPFDELLRGGPPIIEHPDQKELDAICELALRIEQGEMRRMGLVMSDRQRTPYMERSETERARARAGLLRCVQAMVLLGWISLPDHE
jgi:hypothetical protein